MTYDAFVQELVGFSLCQLPTTWMELVELWNARVESGENVDIRRFELAFLMAVEVWHALFTAKSRGKLTEVQWQQLNGLFLTTVIESFAAWPVNVWGSNTESLGSVFEKRLHEYRSATAGVDAVIGIQAMCSIYANHCSDDPNNHKLIAEALDHLTVGTNKLVDVISSVKFTG